MHVCAYLSVCVRCLCVCARVWLLACVFCLNCIVKENLGVECYRKAKLQFTCQISRRIVAIASVSFFPQLLGLFPVHSHPA